jgi:hypothetical protein
MWVAPEIHDPVLLHAPTRKSVACFGAVSLSQGDLCGQPAKSSTPKPLPRSSNSCSTIVDPENEW